MRDAAAGLGTQQGYSGYGAEQGRPELRKAVCDRFYAKCGLRPEEIFVSDGSKCDIGRLQMMFGKEVSVALQDPAYPVYVDSSVIMGMTGDYKQDGTGFEGIEYMLCRPETEFFPDLSKVSIFFFAFGFFFR